MLSQPSTRNWRIVFATVLVVCTVAFAGCMSEEYSTSVGEPTTGDVIDNVSFGEINGLDGARYEMEYSIERNASDNATYWLHIYEYEDGELRPVNLSARHHLDPDRTRMEDNIAPPYEDESAVKYQYRIERGDNHTVVDAVDVTIRVDE